MELCIRKRLGTQRAIKTIYETATAVVQTLDVEILGLNWKKEEIDTAYRLGKADREKINLLSSSLSQ